MPPLTVQQIFDLARGHLHAQRFAEAEPLYRQLLAQFPQEPEILHELGAVLFSSQRTEEARDFFERAAALNPARADYQNNLGQASLRLGRFAEAATAFERALEVDPGLGVVYYNLGKARMRLRLFGPAAACFRRALELLPDHQDSHLELAIALYSAGQLDEAIAAQRAGLARLPQSAPLWNDLGNLLKVRGDLDEAAAAYERALAIDPRYAICASNYSDLFQVFGQMDEALTWMCRSVALDSRFPEAQSNLILTLQLHPAATAAAILAEARRWETLYAKSLPRIVRPSEPDRSPERRLRLGYVSPDFYAHAVGLQMRPLFRAHDRDQFDLICYSGAPTLDAVTAEFRSLATEWRETLPMSDEQLAAQIVEDRVDILIDLALHSLGNRLRAFAYRPAPVQATFAGYPGTTGLDAIDYRLTDRFLDPPGCHDGDYAEESIRLPDSFWCFDPIAETPEVQPPPALNAGHVTFGSLVRIGKVNDAVLALWSRVLQGVPDSRILIQCTPLRARARLQARFAELGIDSSRVLFTERQPFASYFAEYQRIDLILDTFPYNGHTTTLDALWMGVPVVSLTRETAVSRGGLSILSNAGLPELAAATPEEYVHTATNLARDLPRLAALRASLRDRLRSSPLMDTPRYAHGVEAAYRAMWRRWCAT